jgi:hypothetical protein
MGCQGSKANPPGKLPSAGQSVGAFPQKDEVPGELEFSIQVEKTAPELGLGLSITHEKGLALRIDAVKEGPISAWNAQNPLQEVRPLDRIVEVNGVSDDSVEIVRALRQSMPNKAMHIVIKRDPSAHEHEHQPAVPVAKTLLQTPSASTSIKESDVITSNGDQVKADGEMTVQRCSTNEMMSPARLRLQVDGMPQMHGKVDAPSLRFPMPEECDCEEDAVVAVPELENLQNEDRCAVCHGRASCGVFR